MRRCAILIGLNNTQGMPPLAAAVQGAKNMDKWAKSQGYETILLTDENDKVVRLEMIIDAVDNFIKKRVYDQMVIYFAGHGFTKFPGGELWLLSLALQRPNEAIDVINNKLAAMKCGIQHLVLIGDTCRVNPETNSERNVAGGQIFPTLDVRNQHVKVDVFYSTLPGDKAVEVRETAGDQFRGLYTECLLDGLEGRVRNIIEHLNVEGGTYPVVLSDPLNEHVMREVPKRIIERNLYIEQFPIGEIMSRKPLYLSKFETADSEGPERESPIKKTVLKERLSSLSNFYSKKEEVASKINENLSLLKDSTDRFPVPGLLHETGFLIESVGVRRVYVNSGYAKLERFGELTYVTINRLNAPLTCILELEDGRSVPLAVLPDFMGQIIFERNELRMINYIPTLPNSKYNQYRAFRHEIEERKALIMTASRFGVFQSGEDAGDYFRRYKAYDPILGLFAAYGYMNEGRFDDAASEFSYMREEKEPVLFDVEMINHIARPEDDRYRYKTPNVPLLTQGWSYARVKNEPNPAFKWLGEYLEPGLWTTFTKAALPLILDYAKIP